MKFKELKLKSKAEIGKILEENRALMRDLRFQLSNRKLKNTSEIKKAKALIARALTALKQAK